MAANTYTVKRGDTLYGICSNSQIGPKISGNSVDAKINTLVKLNDIPNRNLIYPGQVLKLSDSGSSSSSSSSSSGTSSAPPTKVTFNTLALQSESSTGRDFFAYWTFKRNNIKHFEVRWEYNAYGTMRSEKSTTENTWSTYSIPTEAQKVATRVQVFVKPIANNKMNSKGEDTGVPYWTAQENGKQYLLSNNPPRKPDNPSIKINDLDDLLLECYYDNIDPTDIDATHIVFQIVKDNSTTIHTSGAIPINTVGHSVNYQYRVTAGSNYKVRAKAVKTSNKTESGWTDFSSNVGTKPSAPSAITTCRADTQFDSITETETLSVFLEWNAVPNATDYTIEYVTNREYFTTTSNEIKTVNTETAVTQWRVTGIEIGKKYFFRVRANNNNGTSDPSGIEDVIVGTVPAAPTTWSSANSAFSGEPLNLNWTHNSTDGSRQTYAELWLTINGVREPASYTFSNRTTSNDGEKVVRQKFLYGEAVSYKGTLHIELDTSHHALQNAEIQWEIRTAGVDITKFGDWSIPRTIYIYEKPVLNLSMTADESGSTNLIETLTEFPFYINAKVDLDNYNIQRPIGYHLKVMANEYYSTVDDTGNVKVINKGDAVYSEYFDITGDLKTMFSADNIDLEGGIGYTIFCAVDMSTGLTLEGTHPFEVSWTDAEYTIEANVTVDSETLTATISPYCTDVNGNFVENITLSIYRREYDGTFTKIASGIPNDNNTSVTDPHPSLDYARYRVVARDDITGSISFYDMPGYPVGGTAVIIQWDEEWTTFDVNEAHNVEGPSWSGSLLRLPYNIDVSDTNKPDVALIAYIGRTHPTSYYGTHLGATSTWNVEIVKDDEETLYALRRLSRWMGDVYVREPSGSGYWANVVVSFNQKH
jgi:LysM repeat protein